MTAAYQTKRIKPSTVSTAQLNALLRLHLRPIQLVVFQRSYSLNGMGDLILGRVSHLDAFSGYLCQTLATQRCTWRYNWHTRGLSTLVLSY